MLHEAHLRKCISRGYILLFTLGVLAVISVLILSIALSLRLDAQLLAREKTRLQEEYAVSGAIRYVAARLSVTLESQKQLAGKPFDTVSRRKMWFPDEGPYPFQLAGMDMVAHFEDAGLLPDANLLNEPEWQRLLLELGADSPQSAGIFAKSIVESRQGLTKTNGAAGFASLGEIMVSQSLPQHVARGVNSSVRLDLKDLLVVGTELKQLDINRSPLVLFKVLAGLSDGQLSNLQLARSRGPILPIDGNRFLVGSSAKLMTGKTDMLRVKIQINNGNAPAAGLMAVALLKLESNTYRVIDQFVTDQY